MHFLTGGRVIMDFGYCLLQMITSVLWIIVMVL